MSDIQEGEYIRTKNGGIGKIIEKLVGKWYKIDTLEYSIFADNFAKHSFNIIDLIEVGDYVNGYEVTNLDISIYKSKLEEVKSIVTKEQFKEVEYEVC